MRKINGTTMKKILLILMILLLPLIYAQTDNYYKVNQESSIIIPCSNEGATCSAETNCTISLMYPNGNYFVNSQNMTNNGNGLFNYTITPDVSGQYNSVIFCTDGVDSDDETFTIMVNKYGDGSEYNMTAILSGLGILILVCLALTIFFFILQNALRFMFLLLTFFLITIICFVSYIYTTTMIAMPLSGLFYALYWSFMIITLLLFFLILWDLVKKMMGYFQQKKNKDFNDNF